MGKISGSNNAFGETPVRGVSKRDLLARKQEELRRTRAAVAAHCVAATTSMTRTQLAKVLEELEREKAKLVIMPEFGRSQARSREMKKANGRRGEIDAAFLVDCTASMAQYISAAKKHIRDIVAEITRRYGCRVRLAFVGYRDHGDGQDRIQLLDFVEDLELFEDFVDSVCAEGGGDVCEDVFGGMEAAVDLDWSGNIRCLIHIGDAPPHGNRFHDFKDSPERYDYYPWYNDADVRGLRIEDLIRRMKELKVDYTFGKINDSTNKMLKVFGEVGGDDFVRCTDMANVKNFYAVAVDSIVASVQFNWKTAASGFGSFGEGDDAIPTRKTQKTYEIVKSQPRWSTISERQVNIADCAVSVTGNNRFPLEYNHRTTSVKISPQPFAEGSQRIAYYGVEIISDFQANCVFKIPESVVLKTFKHVGGDNKKDFLGVVESQAVAKYLANEFNRVKPKEAKSIKFLDVKLVETQASDCESPQYYTRESIFPDSAEFNKFNNNWNYVNRNVFTSTLNAFSHWTYDHTQHYLMVVDLQGIFHNREYILTDPAIHCKEPSRFGSTNMGQMGMEAFFEAHRCNNVCALMGLKSNRYMMYGTPNPNITSVVSADY